MKAARKNPVKGSVLQVEGSAYVEVGPDKNDNYTMKKLTPESFEKMIKGVKLSVHFRDGKMFVVDKRNAVEVEYEDGTSETWDAETFFTSTDLDKIDPELSVESIPGLPAGWSGLREEDDGSGDDDYFLMKYYSDFEKPIGWKGNLCGQGDSLQEGDSCIWISGPDEVAKMEVKRDGSLSIDVGGKVVMAAASVGSIDQEGFKAEKTGSGWKITEVAANLALTGGTRVETDTDYLVLWAGVADYSKLPEAKDAEALVIGAFADGSDPLDRDRLSRLTGKANYQGPAFGVHTVKEAGEKAAIGEFQATASLTADFGGSALASVTGEVSGFKVTGGTAGKGSLGEMTVQLEKAELADGELLFKGATASGSGHDGKWGGQFFGTKEPDGKPGSVAGTFGIASGKIGADAYEGAVGAFGAHRQP